MNASKRFRPRKVSIWGLSQNAFVGERVQQERFLAWLCALELCAPLANQLAHIALGAAKLPNLLFERAQFFLGHVEDAMARRSASVAESENLGKFGQSETELQSPPHELYS